MWEEKIFRHFRARIRIKNLKAFKRSQLIYSFNDMKKRYPSVWHAEYLLENHIPDKKVSFSFTHCDTKKLVCNAITIAFKRSYFCGQFAVRGSKKSTVPNGQFRSNSCSICTLPPCHWHFPLPFPLSLYLFFATMSIWPWTMCPPNVFWTMHLLDDASPWTIRPLDETSYGLYVAWIIHPSIMRPNTLDNSYLRV